MLAPVFEALKQPITVEAWAVFIPWVLGGTSIFASFMSAMGWLEIIRNYDLVHKENKPIWHK